MSSTQQCNATQTTAVVGKPAPAVQGAGYFPSGEIKGFDLGMYKGKYVVLIFYPADFSGVCPTEIIGFNHYIQEFKEINCELVGISVDSVMCHQAWCTVPREFGGIGKMEFPLISDASHRISKSYNVFDEQQSFAQRGLFVIDSKGVIRFSEVTDGGIGRSTEETLRVVKAVQFTDENGVVCPLNWKPGKKGVVPTAEGISSYLKDL
ncbi:Peroxiredoxin [Entamoeba marina]